MFAGSDNKLISGSLVIISAHISDVFTIPCLMSLSLLTTHNDRNAAECLPDSIFGFLHIVRHFEEDQSATQAVVKDSNGISELPLIKLIS